MNNKMAKIHICQQLNLKYKLSKPEQRERESHGYEEHFDACRVGGCCGKMGEEMRASSSTNR